MSNINNFLDDFYDYGWNARVENKPFDPSKGIDWKDGWKDCDKAPAKYRVKMKW